MSLTLTLTLDFGIDPSCVADRKKLLAALRQVEAAVRDGKLASHVESKDGLEVGEWSIAQEDA